MRAAAAEAPSAAGATGSRFRGAPAGSGRRAPPAAAAATTAAAAAAAAPAVAAAAPAAAAAGAAGSAAAASSAGREPAPPRGRAQAPGQPPPAAKILRGIPGSPLGTAAPSKYPGAPGTVEDRGGSVRNPQAPLLWLWQGTWGGENAPSPGPLGAGETAEAGPRRDSRDGGSRCCRGWRQTPSASWRSWRCRPPVCCLRKGEVGLTSDGGDSTARGVSLSDTGMDVAAHEAFDDVIQAGESYARRAGGQNEIRGRWSAYLIAVHLKGLELLRTCEIRW